MAARDLECGCSQLGKTVALGGAAVLDSAADFVSDTVMAVEDAKSGDSSSSASKSKKPAPNPNGKKGGEANQGKAEEISADIESRGLEPKREFQVKTPNGEKTSRFVDVVGLDPETGEVVEMHQVGRTTKSGDAIARERRAMDDIEAVSRERPQYHGYD